MGTVLPFRDRMTPRVLEFAQQSGLKGKILEVGSLNVNGSLRKVLPITLGIDCRPGKDVDRVMDVTELEQKFGPNTWDNVACADSLEHMEDWRSAIINMWSILKPNGRLLLTTVGRAKARHNYPNDYWRFERPQFEAIFIGNLEKLSTYKEWIMVIARKVRPLPDLSQIEAYPVP